MADQEVRRGDIWWTEWSGGRGSEQAGERPALVIQNDLGNRFAPTTIIAAITTRSHRLPTIVPIPRGESGLTRDSFIHTGQLISVDKTRLVRRLGRADGDLMRAVDRALRISLAL